MKKEETVLDYLKKELEKRKVPSSDLPKSYDYEIDKRKKNLIIKLKASGLKANMQDNESAFESWAIILKFYLSDLINTVTIDWEEIDSSVKEGEYHFNRFIYRVAKFAQTYDWVLLAKSIPQMPTILVCNYPNGGAAEKKEHAIGSEGWIECNYVEKEKSHYDVINHQFPVGLFDYTVSKYTHFTTGQKSAIDIWAIKDRQLFVFELKKPGNIPLGIISELMFYINVMNDLLLHRIQYKDDGKLEKAIEKNHRGFGDFYNLYRSGRIDKINAVLLADQFHPLINSKLLEFINDSARYRYCNIHFSMQNVE